MNLRKIVNNDPGFCIDLGPGLGAQGFCSGSTWTPKIGKIMAFMAVILGLGLLFYTLLRFR